MDFFPPVVDDPYSFGQIAAANALSDIYAMGGEPRLAMNLLCFPSCLDLQYVRAILEGGQNKVEEAGAVIAGGHSIEDAEPKYGLSVTGYAHPRAILTNANAQEGDLLVLTKPLGSGILSTAAKAGLRPPEYNPFANNIAQAVELVDVLDRCSALCRRLAADEFEGSSEPVPFEVRAGRGVGFTEAPRGALFHILDINGEGRIERASIMTPTAQNIANLEADMRQLAEKMVAGGYDADLITLEVEKLVRAYDPCLSCSVH